MFFVLKTKYKKKFTSSAVYKFHYGPYNIYHGERVRNLVVRSGKYYVCPLSYNKVNPKASSI